MLLKFAASSQPRTTRFRSVGHITALNFPWDKFDRQVRSCRHIPNNIQELTAALQQEWSHWPLRKMNNLVNSMANRIHEATHANGGINDFDFERNFDFDTLYPGTIKKTLCTGFALCDTEILRIYLKINLK